jgi:hypothetical protein
MANTNFNTDSFRDITFDLLSGIANDPLKIDELTENYLIKLHQRNDSDDLRKYSRDIYEKILSNHSNDFILIYIDYIILFRFTNCSNKFSFSIKRCIS